MFNGCYLLARIVTDSSSNNRKQNNKTKQQKKGESFVDKWNTRAAVSLTLKFLKSFFRTKKLFYFFIRLNYLKTENELKKRGWNDYMNE